MAGATAATAGGVITSQASLVTINLTNNYIDGGGNHLNADLTGDGHPDLTIVNAFFSTFIVKTETSFYASSVRMTLNGVFAHAFFEAYNRLGSNVLGTKHFDFSSVYSGTLTGSIPIFFKDLHVNGAAPTKGFVEVTVGLGRVQLDSFTYTSNTPVAGSTVVAAPDQGSSLALLALGAGGVLALRRSRAALASPNPKE